MSDVVKSHENNPQFAYTTSVCGNVLKHLAK